jgi:hypothetical protein
MSQLRLNLFMVAATMILFAIALAINEAFFTKLEFAAGINWIYLPAGVRLLCTLLFGEAGAIGLLLISWAVCFFYFFPNDPIRSFAGGILASAAPYLVYLGAGNAREPLAGTATVLRTRLFDSKSAAPPSLVRIARPQRRFTRQLCRHGDRRPERLPGRALRVQVGAQAAAPTLTCPQGAVILRYAIFAS